jgi:hypothetical protein
MLLFKSGQAGEFLKSEWFASRTAPFFISIYSKKGMITGMEAIPFIVKILLSSAILVGASWLAGKNSVLAGFIIALPLMSMLAILFSYLQYRDMARINEFANSILIAVPLSLTFFIPFLLNKWLKMGFALTYILAIGCLAAAYLLHSLIFKSGLFKP